MRRPKMHTAISVLATALMAAAARPAAAQRTQLQVTVDGVQRSALVYPGSAANSAPSPLVLAFHWYGTTAAAIASQSRIHQAWPEATVVYPEGLSVLNPFYGSRTTGWDGHGGLGELSG